MDECINQVFVIFLSYLPLLWACKTMLLFYAIEQGIVAIPWQRAVERALEKPRNSGSD